MSKRFERVPRSDYETELLDKAAALLPASARTPTMSLASAMIVREGRGSKIIDISGNEYIDYLLGSGPMFMGHAHPAVVKAAQEAAALGSSYLLPNEPSVLLAEELVAAIPCAERIVYSSTGSDATFFALRLARAYRKRDKILKFEGGYHGQGDAVLMSNQWTKQPAEFPQPSPNSEGIPQSVRGDVLVAPFNDLDKTADLLKRHHDELGAIIVEPMQRTIPPKDGFLEGLRSLASEHDVPLIFDEVVTGFRFAYGSAQEYYGVTPDLCALGKSISGGHPISVVGGRGDIMAYAEGVRRLTGEYVSLTGTFSGNPISCAVALAIVRELKKPGAYDALFARGRQLMQALEKHLGNAGLPVQIMGEPPAFETWFTDQEIVDFRTSQTADPALTHRFAQLLYDRGVLKGHEKFFISMVHSDEDIDFTIDAIEEAAAALVA
jgi:glutamate-1-semialdehyde 2,1-aminomutase